MATMTMLSGGFLEKLDHPSSYIHEHDSYSNNTTHDHLDHHGQTLKEMKKSGTNTETSLVDRSSRDYSEVGCALSALTIQEGSTTETKKKKSFGNLKDSLKRHELENLNSCKSNSGQHTTTTTTTSSGVYSHESTPTDKSAKYESDQYRNISPLAYPHVHVTNPSSSCVGVSPNHRPETETAVAFHSPHDGSFSSVDNSSMSSSLAGSHNQSKNGITPYPILYSAIGSLEYMNNSSSFVRDINAKVLRVQEANQFSRVLIPPIRPQDRFSSIITHRPTDEKQTVPTVPTVPQNNNSSTVRLLDTEKQDRPLQCPDPNATTSSKKIISTLSLQLSDSNESDLMRTKAEHAEKSIMTKNKSLVSVSGLNKLRSSSPDLLKSPENETKELRRNQNSTTNDVQTSVLNKKTSNRKRNKKKKKSRNIKPEVIFCPSSDAYTPRINTKSKPLSYLPAADRTAQVIPTSMGTISRPNFRDALRRVAMILHQHIVKIEGRFEAKKIDPTGLFLLEMRNEFREDNFAKPRYKCTMVRVPMARAGAVYSLKKLKADYETIDSTNPSSIRIPTEYEIYEFAHKLFKKVQLSSECSIVCLIYIERLMEVAKVPLMACTWRPIFMAGLLLASKVWQDLSSWNIEFAIVYPQFSLESINRLELQFLRMVKWDLYISSSQYAKYYFALRSLLEKKTFRLKYNRMVGGVGNVDASDALKIQRRTEKVKEEVLLQLSRSM